MNPRDIIYDLETYPNIVTFCFKHVASGEYRLYEISDRVDHSRELYDFLFWCRENNMRLVGYNNLNFDYPITHYFIENPRCGYVGLYQKAQDCIFGDSFENTIWPNKRYIEQVDLFKIHHFDNAARRTSLKVLEYNMKSDTIQDLPFDVGIELDDDQKNTLITYNIHDVDKTEEFYIKTIPKIEFRETLSEKYNQYMMDYSDKRIGSEILIDAIGKNRCYYYDENNRRQKRQTPRSSIDVKDVLFDYIEFAVEEFISLHQWLLKQTITETKGFFKDLHIFFKGIEFVFGTGGLHASVHNKYFEEDDDNIIIDLDVTSYYPSLAIVNRLAPHHLGHTFCSAYASLRDERLSYEKKSPENLALKLALNGAYGDSNNQYSCFYDPAFTMAITLNGQLLLCMLIEWMYRIEGVQLIQANTDGITLYVPRKVESDVREMAADWEKYTDLKLEEARYSRMWVRDVNNYVAQHTDGKVKRKGTYEYKLDWHQNHSQLVVPMCAEAVLLHDANPMDFLKAHRDLHDFTLIVKAPRGSYFEDAYGNKLEKTQRFYVAPVGVHIYKIMPGAGPEGWYKRANSLTDDYYWSVINELGGTGEVWDSRIHTKNKTRYSDKRESFVCATGKYLTPCNDLRGHDFKIDYDYYLKEVLKLTEIFQ